MKRRLVTAGLAATIATGAAAALLVSTSSAAPPTQIRKALAALPRPSRSVRASTSRITARSTCVSRAWVPPRRHALPTKRAGPFPAVVYVHGSGEASRWGWDVPWVSMTVRAGIAFFSYDKRGVGESEGTCCPGDDGHYNLLAADADGALNAVRERARDRRHASRVPRHQPSRLGRPAGRRALAPPRRVHRNRQRSGRDDPRGGAVEPGGRRGGRQPLVADSRGKAAPHATTPAVRLRPRSTPAANDRAWDLGLRP